ncbi:hypothetical protein [Hymenobacter sp. BT523]|nr:hypothetical protein [Hymenobacter sp. BT523]
MRVAISVYRLSSLTETEEKVPGVFFPGPHSAAQLPINLPYRSS